MANPLITVIVPAYNVERYLPRCLDSIVAQTYRNLEIIIVDDGSEDNTGVIADDYAVADDRVRVIHRSNGGLSAARNTALNAMHGSLLTMVDGDDVIAPDMVATLYLLLVDYEAQMAVAAFDKPVADDPFPSWPTPPGNITTYDREEAISAVLYQNKLTHSACARLFRSGAFDNVRFTEGLLYEDLDIFLSLMSRVDKVVYTDRVMYHYVQRPTSIIGHFSMARTVVLDVTERIEQRVATEMPQHLGAARSRRMSACFNILLLCPRGDEAYASVVERCRAGIKQLRWGCLFDPHVRFKNKVGIIVSYLLGFDLLTRLFGKK